MVWLIEADFTAQNAEPTQRLLKPGRSYTIGRKPPADIVIPHKTVSADAGVIHVEAFDEAQIAEPDYRPQVSFTAGKKGNRIIAADDEASYLANTVGFVGNQLKADDVADLNEGDRIIVAKTNIIKLIWKPLLFNAASKKDKLAERISDAALIGAHLRTAKGTPECDVYVTTTAGLTTAIMGIICRAVPVVSPAYVDEVLRLGALPASDPASLEANFRLPDPDFFKPAVNSDNDVVPEEELLAALSVNRDRPTLLKGCTTLFIDTGAEILEGQIMIAERCGATVERVASAAFTSDKEIRQILGRQKAKASTALAKHRDRIDKLPQGGLVILVDDPTTVLKQSWYAKLIQAAIALSICMPSDGASQITYAVVHSDAKAILEQTPEMPEVDTQAADAQSQREQTPPAPRAATPPAMDVDEPAPQPQSLLAPMAAPASLQAESAQPATQAKKIFKRRNIVVTDPLDDLFGPSGPIASTSKSSNAGASSSVAAPAGTAAASSSRTGTAKSRARAPVVDDWASIFDGGGGSSVPTGAQSASSSMFPATQQSRTSKFRAKLTEADAKASQAAAAAETQQSGGAGGDSQMAPPTAASTAPAAASQRAAAAEETQEARATGKKRAAASPAEDEEMGDGDTATASRKKRTAELKRATKDGTTASSTLQANEAQSQAPGKVVRERQAGKAGIGPGERPDRDDGFLQALATKGRGKKSADQFDKEFNQLRIAKPNGGSTYVDQDEADDQAYERFRQAGAEELDQLFSKKSGNFVEVDFVPLIYAKPERDVTQQQSFDNVPNFKKFKKKVQARRAPMALSMPVEQDFVTGGHQRTSTTQAQAGEEQGSQVDELDEEADVLGDVDLRPSSTSAAAAKKGKSIFAAGSDDDEEEEDEDGPILGNKRCKTGAKPTPRARSGAGARAVSSRARSKAPIALSDEDDIDLNEVDEAKEPEVDLRLDVDFDGMDTTIEEPRRATSSRARGKSTRARSDSQASTAGGSAAPATRTSKKRTITLDDSDDAIDEESDDEVTFGGFKKSTRGRVPPSSAANKRTRR